MKSTKLIPLISSMIALVASRPFSNVSMDSIIGKNMIGYQGWFRCKDGVATRHWHKPNLVVDMLPDVSEYDPEDLCTLEGYQDSKGNPVKVFSSESPGVVDTHFRWMEEYGIDGVFLQQFVSELKSDSGKEWRLKVAENVKRSAEKHGRTWAIMFDASGAAKECEDILRNALPDFIKLIESSPNYLHEKGRPLVALWGIGGRDKHLQDPKDALKVVNLLKEQGFAIFGGFARDGWRNNYGKDQEWTALVKSMDVISPWTVGSRRTDYLHFKRRVESDIKLLDGTGIIYSPVIFPGFSNTNLKQGRKPLNEIPRSGGQFYMNLANAALDGGAQTLYTAMFDEMNEGTAILKQISRKSDLPTKGSFAAFDIDGQDIPSDHYLKLAGRVSRKLISDPPDASLNTLNLAVDITQVFDGLSL